MKKGKIYTLEELREQHEAFEKKLADGKAEIAANKAELEVVAQQMDAATMAGDVDTYKKLHARRSDLELNMEAVSAIIERAEADNAQGFTDDDVRASWAACVSDWNKGAGAKAAELKRLQTVLLDKYMQYANEQNEILKKRDAYAQYLTRKGWNGTRPIDFETVRGLPEVNTVLRIEPKEEKTANGLRIICDNLDCINGSLV